jgi:NADH:ubiquinone reductase (H+-translocating)
VPDRAPHRVGYFGHDDWRQHAPELKSLEGALEIRSRILAALEAAEWEPDPVLRRAWLTFVVVGAGPTGVEMAGQIAELAHDLRRDFHRAGSDAARVLLVETGERVLSGFPRSLPARAAAALEALGTTPPVRHTVTDIAAGSVTLRTPDGRFEQHAAGTVIWAAGVVPSRLAGALAHAGGGELDQAGRLIVEADLTVAGHPEVLALATIGRARAVVDLRVVRLSGAPARITWLAVHLFYLIGVENRLLVLTRWTFSFLGRGRGARLISRQAGPDVSRASRVAA